MQSPLERLVLKMFATRIAYIVLGVISLGFACFCVLGFLHSFEPGPNNMNWRIGYSVAFVASALLTIFFLRQGFKMALVKKK